MSMMKAFAACVNCVPGGPPSAVEAELYATMQSLRYSPVSIAEALEWFRHNGGLGGCPSIDPLDLVALTRLLDAAELAAAEAEDWGDPEGWPAWTDEARWVPTIRRPTVPGEKWTDADQLVHHGCV